MNPTPRPTLRSTAFTPTAQALPLRSWAGLRAALLMAGLLLGLLWTSLALAQDAPDPAPPAEGQESLILPGGPSFNQLPPGGQVVEAADLPAWVERLQAQAERGQIRQDGPAAVVRKSANTGYADGEARNGEFITYTIVITNNSPISITGLTLVDVLPRGSFQSIRCIPDTCQRINETVEIPEPLGGTIIVTETRQLSWDLPNLPQGGSLTRRFTAQLVGQSDGSSIKNQAFLAYFLGNQELGASSNETQTTVRVITEQGVGATLSRVPNWFSGDRGGTISLAWGDFDRDGYLDLALASSTGTTVYRNQNGRLVRFWQNPRRAFGAVWGDFNGDGQLELFTVGDGEQNQVATNYFYRLEENAFQESGRITSTNQLVRAIAGDFTGDGSLDLVVSTNAINAPCPVMLYRNDGAGNFSYTPPAGNALNDCISRRATAALSAADANNNGRLDLALGIFPNSLQMLFNNGSGNFRAQPPVTVDSSISFLPYDMRWGDFDGDGYLDLAAAYPLLRQVRIYRNVPAVNGGRVFQQVAEIRTERFLTPLSVDWGDFTGDGRLDLAVADTAVKIYSRIGGEFVLQQNLTTENLGGQIWRVRGVDVDNDGDADLSLTDRNGPSLLFSSFSPRLGDRLIGVPADSTRNEAPSSSVAWADINGDGALDLIYGGGPSEAGAAGLSVRIFPNSQGVFDRGGEINFEGFGPHPIAIGDMNGDGTLELAIGADDRIAIYRAGEFNTAAWSYNTTSRVTALAWGDYDDDQDLDLLVTTANGTIMLFCNALRQSSTVDTCAGSGPLQLSAQPIWQTQVSGRPTALAWADVNRNYYLDFAVGVDGGPNRIFLNDRRLSVNRNSFTLSSWSPAPNTTRAIAWGDYDGDGDLDLVVGNFGAANQIYENRSSGPGVFDFPNQPIWVSATTSRTTSLAWGDYDGDGDLDLAVGNLGEADQVYVNRRDPNSPTNVPQLFWVWSSPEQQQTTGVAWGDVDRDGDLDLAVSQRGGGINGYYANNLINPTHLRDEYASSLTLPQSPIYLSVRRPGSSLAADLYSVPRVFSGPQQPVVTIPVRVYDASGGRNIPGSNLPGRVLSLGDFRFEYSLSGGGPWRTATPASAMNPSQTITPTRLGTSFNFLWDARADQAISDNVRFRVRVVQPHGLQDSRQGETSATSLPFRVRGTSCVWPSQLGMRMDPMTIQPEEVTTFLAFVVQGTGMMTFRWDMGDGTQLIGQRVTHNYVMDGIYTVRLTVTGENCPIGRSLTLEYPVTVGDGEPASRLFMPLISRSGSSALRLSDPVPDQATHPTGPDFALTLSASGQPTLEWAVQSGEAGSPVAGYQVYRVDGDGEMIRVASLPGSVTRLVDSQAPVCGSSYWVSVVDGAGQEWASSESYMLPGCDDEATR